MIIAGGRIGDELGELFGRGAPQLRGQLGVAVLEIISERLASRDKNCAIREDDRVMVHAWVAHSIER